VPDRFELFRMKNHLPCLPVFGLLLFSFAAALPTARADNPSLINFNIETSPPMDNPWAGVDSTSGNLRLPLGAQFMVNDNGDIVKNSPFSPSIAVGDLNGDGLPDLVVADGRGYIWFYPNVGTKTKAAFSHGEIIPIWFGSTDILTDWSNSNNVVPRIQLVDFNNDGKLDLVVGTYVGRLYLMPNVGSPTKPEFRQPTSIDALEVPTHTDHLLWCNFLAPDLYAWGTQGVMDLIMGEGTYSANSIYLFRNQGGAGNYVFDEKHKQKIIRGNGSEHLTPRVIDWNGDGKPDIISGERSGYINLYLNTTTDPANPTFADGQRVKIGSQEQFGQLTTLEVADLNGNHLPNLLFANTSGQIFYATNTGTPGHPVFTTPPEPLKGVNPYPRTFRALNWTLSVPFGTPYEMLVATSADIEKGFQPPPDHKGKFAMRAYVYTPQTTWFNGRYVPDPSAFSSLNTASQFHNEHAITYDPALNIQTDTRYQLDFSGKVDGEIQNPRFDVYGFQILPTGKQVESKFDQNVQLSGSWSKISEGFTVPSLSPKQPGIVVRMRFSFRWTGQGSIYIDDVVLKKAN
jgi:hypothetical protein